MPRPKMLFESTPQVWIYSGDAAWHFVTIPKDQADEINRVFKGLKRGWGSVRVIARVGATVWNTSIFPDKEAGSFMLPLKKEVRIKEDIFEGSVITLRLEIEEP
jgi:hypothetical protein